jgi:hypothetical protein
MNFKKKILGFYLSSFARNLSPFRLWQELQKATPVTGQRVIVVSNPARPLLISTAVPVLPALKLAPMLDSMAARRPKPKCKIEHRPAGCPGY